MRVECDGCLRRPVEKFKLKKIQKIFKLELAKQKIGDILRIRCVLSATRLIDKTAESGSK